MKRIVHLSDLHFGTEVDDVPEILLEEIRKLAPDLVVVSGDLTQRSTAAEWRDARDFLSRIRFPQLVVPGNHDIPWLGPVRRFAFPLGSYKRYITTDLFPVHRDDEMIVLGISTPRPYHSVRGSISKTQRAYLRERLCGESDELLKVIVTHHPFVPPPFPLRWTLVRRGLVTLEDIRDCGADLLLAGHLHRGYIRDVKSFYPSLDRSVIIVQAGTATSRRQRGESNSFNLITVEGKSFTVTAKLLRGEEFISFKSISYLENERQWRKGDTVLHP